jgi:hypothetical protein
MVFLFATVLLLLWKKPLFLRVGVQCLALTLEWGSQDKMFSLLCRGVLKHQIHAGAPWPTRAPWASRLPQQLWPGDSALHLRVHAE